MSLHKLCNAADAVFPWHGAPATWTPQDMSLTRVHVCLSYVLFWFNSIPIGFNILDVNTCYWVHKCDGVVWCCATQLSWCTRLYAAHSSLWTIVPIPTCCQMSGRSVGESRWGTICMYPSAGVWLTSTMADTQIWLLGGHLRWFWKMKYIWLHRSAIKEPDLQKKLV